MNYATKSSHGTHQEIHIGEFSADKYGVISGTIERHRRERFDAPDWGYLALASAPALVSVPCVGAKRNFDEKLGMAIYAYSFQGLEPSDVGFEDRVFCALEGTDNEEPIETHPAFADLYKKYSGRPEPGTSRFGYFDRLLKLGTAPVAGGIAVQVPNPLYGVTHFLTVGLVWSHTSIAKFLPQNILSRVDCIDTPMGHGAMQPPALKGQRNWLQIAPSVQERGNCIQITRRWLASGKAGWNKDVYSEKHSAGNSGSAQ